MRALSILHAKREFVATAESIARDQTLTDDAVRRLAAWARAGAAPPPPFVVPPSADALDLRERKLVNYAHVVAFGSHLGSPNKANLAARAGTLTVNGERATGAHRVTPGDVLALELAASLEKKAVSDADGSGELAAQAVLAAARKRASRLARFGASMRNPASRAPPLAALHEDDDVAVVASDTRVLF